MTKKKKSEKTGEAWKGRKCSGSGGQTAGKGERQFVACAGVRGDGLHLFMGN